MSKNKITKQQNDLTTFIVLCARKYNKRGCKNIPLTPITKRQALIDIQIKNINSVFTNNEIIIISGFEHDLIVNHIHDQKYTNVRIIENQLYTQSSIIDGWKIGLNAAVQQNTYIIHGDRLFSTSCLLNDNSNTYLLTHKYDKQNYNLGITTKNNYELMNMSYGLHNVWSEICFIAKNDFDIARNILNRSEQYKLYSIEHFINCLSTKIPIMIYNKNNKDVQTIGELI